MLIVPSLDNTGKPAAGRFEARPLPPPLTRSTEVRLGIQGLADELFDGHSSVGNFHRPA